MMKRSSLVLASAASLLAACMSPVLGEKTATIVIATAPAPGSRALTETWPMGGLPVFSDITVSVLDSKGNEMLLPKEPSVNGNSITVTVSAGKDMTIVVDAAPDWDATASAYDTYEGGFPTLVTMYSGKKTFSVNAGETAAVTIALATSGTKILLPHQVSGPSVIWSIMVANSLADPGEVLSHSLGNFSADSFFDYDKYGHFYVSCGTDVVAYRDIGSGSCGTANYGQSTIRDIAVSETKNRLYVAGISSIFYSHLDNLGFSYYTVQPPTGYSFTDGFIAVDSAGSIYASAVSLVTEATGILKVNVDEPVGMNASSEAVAFATLQNLSVGYWTNSGSTFNNLPIEDMTIVDNELYIITSDVNYSWDLNASYSRGKIIAINISSLAVSWESGWRTDANRIPTVPNDLLFYGPKRFVAIAPKKLYLVDEGFYWNGARYAEGFFAVDRIVEVDRETASISSYGLVDIAEFYDTFDTLNVC